METDLCSACRDTQLALVHFGIPYNPEDVSKGELRAFATSMLNSVYPQGRSLVGLKQKLSKADSYEAIKAILWSPAYVEVLLREYRAHFKNESALDRLLGAGNIRNIFPGGMAAMKMEGLTDENYFERLSSLTTKLIPSAYTTYFLTGLGGGWNKKDGRRLPPNEAATLIVNSAEFAALLRVKQGTLTDAEKLRGYTINAGEIDKGIPEDEFAAHGIDGPTGTTLKIQNLVKFWHVQEGQRRKAGKKKAAQAKAKGQDPEAYQKDPTHPQSDKSVHDLLTALQQPLK